jgi:hypothetical protein
MCIAHDISRPPARCIDTLSQSNMCPMCCTHTYICVCVCAGRPLYMTNVLVVLFSTSYSSSSDPIFCVAFYRLSLHSVSLSFLSFLFFCSPHSLSSGRSLLIHPMQRGEGKVKTERSAKILCVCECGGIINRIAGARREQKRASLRS